MPNKTVLIIIVATTLLLAITTNWFSQQKSPTYERIRALHTQPAAALDGNENMSKIVGKPIVPTPITPPKTTEKRGVLFFRHTKEHLIAHTEQSENPNPTDNTDQPIAGTWTTVHQDEQWAPFLMGSIAIEPSKETTTILQLEELFSEEGKGTEKDTEKEQPDTTTTPETPTATATKTEQTALTSEATESTDTPTVLRIRERVEILPIDEELLVIGAVKDSTINDGTPFIISNMTEAEVLATFEQPQNITFWLLKLLTTILFAGMTSSLLLLSPLKKIPIRILLPLSLLTGALCTLAISIFFLLHWILVLLVILTTILLLRRKKVHA